MAMYVVWYDRNADFTPNYTNSHRGTIRGESAAEIMAQFRNISNNHDLAKYTRLEIVGISD